MGRNTCNVCRTFNTMIWCGLLTIWTRCVAALSFPTLRSSWRRRSIVSILAVPLPGSVYANSRPYAAIRRYSQRRTRFPLTFWKSIPNRSLQEDPEMYTREPSTDQRFASNAYGRVFRVISQGLLKCVIDAVAFPPRHH